MKKSFDCVEMKHKIQQKLLKKYANVSESEMLKSEREKVKKDPVLGAIYSNLQKRKLKLA